LEDLWFKYKTGKEWIFKSVNLELDKRNWVIVGPNGSGKTTFLKLIMGIEKPSSGKIFVLNRLVKKPHDVVDLITYVPTNIRNYLIGPTVEKELERSLQSSEKIDYTSLLDDLNINFELSKPIYHLSEGERRILAILSAILLGKKIIILDEPTIGLDKRYRERILEIIKKSSSKTYFLIASNDIRFISRFSHMVYISRDRTIYVGRTKDLMYEIRDLSTVSAITQLAKKLNLESYKPITPVEIARIISGE